MLVSTNQLKHFILFVRILLIHNSWTWKFKLFFSIECFASQHLTSISIHLIAIMSIKIEYDDAVSTIGTYNQSNPVQISTISSSYKKWSRRALQSYAQSTILGWTQLFMRPKIYAFSEPNPWQDPFHPGKVPPDMRNFMATEVEGKHHCNQWKILKNLHDSLSTLVMLSAQHLTRPFQINLNQSNKLEIVVLEMA